MDHKSCIIVDSFESFYLRGKEISLHSTFKKDIKSIFQIGAVLKHIAQNILRKHIVPKHIEPNTYWAQNIFSQNIVAQNILAQNILPQNILWLEIEIAFKTISTYLNLT